MARREAWVVHWCEDTGLWNLTIGGEPAGAWRRQREAIKSARAEARTYARHPGRRVQLRVRSRRTGRWILEHTYPRSSDPRRFKG